MSWFKPIAIFPALIYLSTTFSSLAVAKPKFFICPPGFERDATVVTVRYDVNLCSRTRPQAGIDLFTYNIVAIRHRRTKKQINLPITTDDDIVYVARSKQGTIYRFDFNRSLLTIQPKIGKATTEKIIASD